MDTLRILCVHGVGHGDLDPQLQPTWTNSLTGGIQRWNPEQQVECDFIFYDDLFAKAPLDAATGAVVLP